MFIAAFRAQVVQGTFEVKEILPVLATWANALIDGFGYFLRLQCAQKLGIVGHTDVDQAI